VIFQDGFQKIEDQKTFGFYTRVLMKSIELLGDQFSKSGTIRVSTKNFRNGRYRNHCL